MEGTYNPIPDNLYSKHLIGLVHACMNTNPDKRPNSDEVAHLVGPKFLISMDKLRIDLANEIKENKILSSQNQTFQETIEELKAHPDAMDKKEEELKMVQIDTSKLVKIVDPVSKMTNLIHGLLFIEFSTPNIKESQNRIMLSQFIRKLFKDKKDSIQVKSELLKVKIKS